MKTIFIFFILSLTSVLAQNWQLHFDGVDDFCNVPNAEELFSNLDVFTVEVWIKSSDISNSPIFVGSGSLEILFGIASNGAVAFNTSFNSGGLLVGTSAGAFPVNGMWHHIACVRTGRGTGQGKIYIDGVDQTDPNYNTTGAAIPLSGNLSFGIGLGTFLLNGSMDELRIWNVARSETEINNNKDIQLSGNESGLIGYWQFNEGSGQTILDSQTNGTIHSGTLGADGNVNSDDPTRIQDSGLPLPVELTSFTANVSNEGNVILNWKTATETNNQMFEIERRSENNQFITIGYVEGHGTTTEEHHYSFKDKDVSGFLQYRLKQVDFDGSYEYSDIVEVEAFGSISYELAQNYPNPFNPITNISYILPTESQVKLSIYNQLGELVETIVNEKLNAGKYDALWNATNYPSGVYIYTLDVFNINGNKQTKISKKMILMK